MGSSQCFKVERDYDLITPEEEKKHYKACREAKKEEIKSFLEHKVFKIMLRKGDKNLKKPVFINEIKAIWVLRWKNKEGKRVVKARLCVQGFRDRQHLETVSSSTATRTGQRAISSLAVVHKWQILCLDISTAFLQGLTFDELAKLTGTPKRNVQMTVPQDVWELLIELKADKLLQGVSSSDCGKLFLLALLKCV